MSSSAKKQKTGIYEKSLAQLGDRQMAFAQEFNPATDAVVKAAQRNDTAQIRARGNTDVSLAFAGDKGATVAASSGSVRGLAEQTGLETSARTETLGEASKRGLVLRDSAIDKAGKLLLGQAADTTRGLQTAATTEFDSLAQKAKIASERRSENLGLATAALSAAATTYAGSGPKRTINDKPVNDSSVEDYPSLGRRGNL